jgi:hypothetical protein
MNRRISNYRKTEHFLYRQWDRGITDEQLIEILKFCPQKKSNTLIVVSRKVLKQLGVKKDLELFIKSDKASLITCFFGSFQNYILNCRKQQKYFIINSLAPNAKN